jgi:hypothetical protein
MTWTKLQASQRREIAGVAVSIVREKKAQVAARLNVRVAKHLGEAAGFSKEVRSRVDVFLGDGPDAGRMMVKGSEHGSQMCRGERQARRLHHRGRGSAEFPAPMAFHGSGRRHRPGRRRDVSAAVGGPGIINQESGIRNRSPDEHTEPQAAADVPIFPAFGPARSATPAFCRAPSPTSPLPRCPSHSRLASRRPALRKPPHHSVRLHSSRQGGATAHATTDQRSCSSSLARASTHARTWRWERISRRVMSCFHLSPRHRCPAFTCLRRNRARISRRIAIA